MTTRASGVLLHPTSLANRFGVGDLGESARSFLDWLQAAGQTVWQILPLGPVGHGNSPYDAQSSYAGNPQLISLTELASYGLLEGGDLETAACPVADRIDHDAANQWKNRLLRKAWDRLQNGGSTGELVDKIHGWASSHDQALWLPDWTLYAALKQRFESRSWADWPISLRDRERAAIDEARRDLSEEIRYQEFVQFLFFEQLHDLRARARDRSISLLGDLPFYVALDSCDVWTHPHLFDLDESGAPIQVAGVPPDYFSASGQRWGNPIYRWDRLADQGFAWWIDRLAAQLRVVDRLRLDHFRAFSGYWEIPATEPTAVEGCWREGPGYPFFQVVRERLGRLPFVAEDLGLITPDVEALRARLQIPGMRVLQFAFDSADSPHLPHNLSRDVVLYTGTHDNDTAQGWIHSADPPLRQRALDYLGSSTEAFHWDLLRCAQTSIADLVMTPIQDVAGLDGLHRINTPGTSQGNWEWRLPRDTLSDELASRLRRMTELSGRLPATELESPA
jgi:4-alpha-glucanotransferase